MSHPLRIQRKRIKGWKMPEGAIYVGRPGLFGNPFETAASFRCWLERLTDGHPSPATDSSESRRMKTIAKRLHELKGKQLACWCSLDKPCHADVLAEMANGSTRS